MISKKWSLFSKSSNKLRDGNLLRSQDKTLEEHVSSKKLCSKEEIIKKFVETENFIFNAISIIKYNKQYPNTLNEATFPLHSSNLCEAYSINIRQLASQEKQYPPISPPRPSQPPEQCHPTETYSESRQTWKIGLCENSL